MAIDFSFIDHDILGDIADAIRFVEGSTAGIAPADYPQRIRALDKYIPDYDVLNFTMPNGGTISLNKTGSPTVVELEYWLDANAQWLIWQPDVDGNRSITLTAGQTVYIRNTSETSTGFSTSSTDFYGFVLDSDTYASGSVQSLLCKTPTFETIGFYCFIQLFDGCSHLLSSPEFPATTLTAACYYRTLRGTSITVAPELPATTAVSNCYNTMLARTPITKSPYLRISELKTNCYANLFYMCSSLNEVRTDMTDISATNCLYNWLDGVAATGDFYCPAELTIHTGGGIPSGWIRHDINELNS